MSKRINVNPDHYKLAGRDRPGHIFFTRAPKPLADNDAARVRWLERQNRKERAKVEK